MDVKTNLTIEHKLVMTPLLRQSIELLQLNVTQLDEYIEKAILDNPVIEKNENKSSTFINPVPSDIPDIAQESLNEHLKSELLSSNINKRLLPYAQAIIDRIDENGYIKIPKSALAKEYSLSIDELKEIFHAIYQMEPAGIGAYNLSQCLDLQLRASGKLNKLASEIIRNHLDDLLSNKLKLISDNTKTDIKAIQKIADDIRLLDPTPGKAYSSYDGNRYIIPDVIIKSIDGNYYVYINNGTGSEIHLNEDYVNMFRENRNNPEIAEFLKDRIFSAKQLISAIENRNKTLLKITQALINEQILFLENGVLFLKPLSYDDIAQKLNIHKSTVCRSVKGKYVRTPNGTFPMRKFFSSGINDNSSLSLKERICKLIESEDKTNPLSDKSISDILNTQGIQISRRTVSKYREQLGILDSRHRKRFTR